MHIYHVRVEILINLQLALRQSRMANMTNFADNIELVSRYIDLGISIY